MACKSCPKSCQIFRFRCVQICVGKSTQHLLQVLYQDSGWPENFIRITAFFRPPR